MAPLRFKNFSDLAFIQGVDKVRFFRPLLDPHKAYFQRQGLDVARLENGDEHDRRLLEVFTNPDAEMPSGLLDSLYLLDDLADDAGHDRILAEAERQRVQLNGVVGEEMSPGELAIAVQLQHPKIVRRAHEMTLYRKIRNYEEYRGKGNKTLTLKASRAGRAALEAEMAPWFEAKNRSKACEIYVYEEAGEIKSEIMHGRPYRTEGTLEKVKRSRVAYRPQKHDSVIYDTRTGVLKLNAQTAAEKELYRKSFGKILFDDAGYFADSEIYTLAPLRQAKPKLVCVTGMKSVRMTEACVKVDDDPGVVQTSRGHDLIAMTERHGTPNLAQGEIVRASFFIDLQSGGRPRRLEIRRPNVALYDRARDGVVVEAFLRANGFFSAPK